MPTEESVSRPRRDPVDIAGRYDAFLHDILALRAEAFASLGAEDIEHLQKIERWGRLCTAGGYATAWLAPNLLSAALLSLGSTARWTIVTHHVTHKGMDKVPGVPARLTSKEFGVGNRRWSDWLDWIHPDAWRHEHNLLHHYHLGESDDPDLVEENVRALRESNAPLLAKYLAVAFFAGTWKLSYYAPNTFAEWRRAERRRNTKGEPVVEPTGTYARFFDVTTEEGRAFFRSCVLPYASVRFGMIPLLFAPLGLAASLNVWINTAIAEVFTNVHTFAIIVPNHAGDDVVRFDAPISERAEFFVRQITGSVNYTTGGDVNDFLHGWLNYQIEHHLFPDLPPLRYRQLQPKVKALCEKHGLPYRQESVLRRVRKLVDVMVGKTSMLRG